MQGFGLQVSPFDIATPKFEESLTAVLTERRFREAAKGLSTILRARKNTPVQEAAGPLN